MFPRALAEGAFSLRAGEATPALAISAELAPDGALTAAAAAPATVRVAARMSYAEVDAADAAGRLAAAPGSLHLLMQARPYLTVTLPQPCAHADAALARARARRRTAQTVCDMAVGCVPAAWLADCQKRVCSRQSCPRWERACSVRKRVPGLAPAGLRGGQRRPVGPRRADATSIDRGPLRCAAWAASLFGHEVSARRARRRRRGGAGARRAAPACSTRATRSCAWPARRGRRR